MADNNTPYYNFFANQQMKKLKHLQLTVAFLVFFALGSAGQDVYIQYGKASFYADKFQGRTTANGEKQNAC